MKQVINTEIIGALKPCEDRLNNWKQHYGDQELDYVEFLSLDQITVKDKIWVMVRVLPRFELEVFAIDCAFSAYAAYDAAAYAAAAYAAYDAAAYAAVAADAAVAAVAAGAAAAVAAAADAASHVAAAADAAAERERQIDCLIYLIEDMDQE